MRSCAGAERETPLSVAASCRLRAESHQLEREEQATSWPEEQDGLCQCFGSHMKRWKRSWRIKNREREGD